MTSGVRRYLAVGATVALLGLAGCDSAAKAPAPGPVTTPAAATIAATTPAATGNAAVFDGTWTGTWSRTTPPQTTNKITFVLHQSGATITGTVDTVGAICITKGAVTGSAFGTEITMHTVTPAATGGGQATGDYSGTVVGDHLTGTLTGTCAVGVGAGTWDVTRG